MAQFEALAADEEAAAVGTPTSAPLEIDGRPPEEHYATGFADVMAGETLPIADANWLNRGFGLLEALGGAVEVGLGVAGMGAPTGVTQVGGALLAAHGVDTFTAGVRQLWTGEETSTLTAQGVTAASTALGADEDMAKSIGTWTDAGIGILGTLGMGWGLKSVGAAGGALADETKLLSTTGAATKDTAAAVSTGTSAYEVALSGGKHAGFLKNYLGKTTAELEKAIASIEKQVAEHQAKILDPEKYLPNWSTLPIQQQQALVQSKWPADIARQLEQIDILKGILGTR